MEFVNFGCCFGHYSGVVYWKNSFKKLPPILYIGDWNKFTSAIFYTNILQSQGRMYLLLITSAYRDFFSCDLDIVGSIKINF